MSKKPRFVSFFLALVMVVSSIPVAPAYAQNEDTISEITNPFRSDVSFTAEDSTVTSDSFRIPSMVTLSDGTIVAAADIRWNTTYDGGGLDTLVARSTDGGKTWSYNAANYLGDNGNQYNGSLSTAFLDPCLTVGADGKTVYMLVDLYPYGVALNGSGHTQPTEKVGFNDDGCLLLSGDDHKSYSYYLNNGKIYNSSNIPVEGYEVDAYFNISGSDGTNTNLFCENSPYKVVRTGYLYLTSSKDGGATWSTPTLLNVKTAFERVCLVAPGSSITTSDGTMIFPVYSYHGDNDPSGNTQRLSFIYSKDGVNWSRTSEFNHNWASEAAVVELNDGTLRFFFRNGTKKLCYVDYDMENGWGDAVETASNTNSNTQISAITYSRTSNGKQVILVSCPTGSGRNGSNSSSASDRLNGSIFVFTVASNGDMKLENTIYVNENNSQFIYSCLTERSDGSVLILFENKENGWGVGDGKYYTMDIKGYHSSELGLSLDEPQTVIMDASGNPVDSIAMGQYEKPELTAKAPFNSSNVAYQWQIEYEDGKWVDIYGEDSKTVKLSFGMVATLLGNDGRVDIRCETTAGTQVAYSEPITVTIEMYQFEAPDVVVSDSFVTSSGESVTVTVAGTLPDGASVVLGETDSSGVDVKPNETVVAALDISIKNADGTEWQPESGESVHVTLEASQIGLQNGDEFVVYHLHNGEVRVLGSYEVVSDTISFDVDGFSKFVFARTEDEAVIETPEYSENIGKHAHFAWNDSIVSIDVTDEEPDENFSEVSKAYSISEFSTDFTLRIDGYKVVTQCGTITTEDQAVSQNGSTILDSILNLLWGKDQGSQTNTEETIEIRSLWYQVSVVTGTAPEDFVDGCWILQNYLTEADAYPVDSLVLFDAPEEPEVPDEPSVGVTVNGQDVTEIKVSTAQKVTLTATPTTEGRDVAFRWQLLIPQANMWVDIAGQTDAKCTVNYGMVADRIDADGKAYIRCVATVNGEEIISEPVAVNIAEVAEEIDAQIRSARAYTRSAANDAIMLAAADDTVTTTVYNVVIQYLFADGTQAANPWTATIEAGGDFSGTIKSPAVVGYAPDHEETVVEIQNISTDETYTVYYRPAEVGFIVIHQLQNVDNDDYYEFRRVRHTGYTESPVGSELSLSEEEMDELGLYALPYDVEKEIAADGSTQIIIKYDRYYYLMTFDLAGGYGVEPIYARAGTSISVGTPTRAGYAFAGWSPSIPGTMPAKDSTIHAQWAAGNTTYIVAYWAENANDDGYSFWGYKEISAVSGATVSGSDDFDGTADLPKTGFHFDHADQNVVVKGDGSTTVNVYYKRNTYTLTFAYEGGSDICDVHVHSTTECYELTCTDEEHSHTYDGSYNTGGIFGWGATTYYVGGCYADGDIDEKTGGGTSPKCGKSAHTHDRKCYTGDPICGQTGVTNHTCSVQNGCYGIKFEHIKYGQDTSYWWNQAPEFRWKTTYSDNTAYTYAPAMPNSDLTVYGQKLSSTYQYTIHYYEEGTTNKVHADNVYYRDSNNYNLTDEDYIAIPGFVCLNSGKTNHSNRVYNIYYRRQSYNLSFKNGNEIFDKGKWLYEADISKVIDDDASLKNPTYTGDDPEGYEFAGWYTTERCIAGTEWNPENATMPHNNLMLYAKWVPVKHHVRLYITKAALESGNQYLETIEVDHNGTVQEPAIPDNGEYKFVGWFYMEDGVEKGYDFDIPVRKDMDLYAKWYADELADYTIKYAVQNGDELIYIADDTTGKAVAGYDKTFIAKAANELYDGYRSGYYPETNSHNMVIQLGEDNIYTFFYVAKEQVKYTVRYLEKGTNKVLQAEKVNATAEAIHTENFVYVSGYTPDAYQKRLVLSANESENVITFWYEVDTVHAPVLVKHYLQNPDGKTYNTANPYLTTTDLEGVINSSYSVDVITNLEGFRFARAQASYEQDGKTEGVNIAVNGTQISATVTKHGLLIELYYDRIAYPYEFRFVLQGSDTQLHTPVTGTAIFGSQVVQSALNVSGYKCSTQSQSLTIQAENGSEAIKNVRTFYYVEETVNINYVPVGSGTTSPVSQLNVPVISGQVGGSTATPDEGHKFVGWYMDESCTIPVDTSWVNGNTITPAKSKNYGGTMGYESATFYAKFEYDLTSLTIDKVFPSGADYSMDENQSFLFDVVEVDENGNVVSNGVDLTVAIHGDGDVTIAGLTVGHRYKITEKTDWSWRYTPSSSPSITVMLTADAAKNTVTFTNNRSNKYWLSGDSRRENQFTVTKRKEAN